MSTSTGAYLAPTARAMGPGSSVEGVPLFLATDLVDDGAWGPLLHRDFVSLYLVDRGRGRHLIDDRSYAVARGDVYTMPIGSSHGYSHCDRLRVDGVHFGRNLLPEPTWRAIESAPGYARLDAATSGDHRLHLTPSGHRDVARAFGELRGACVQPPAIAAILLPALVTRLLLHLAEAAGSPPGSPTPPTSHRDRIADAVRVIDERHADPLRIGSLAAAAHLSRYRFTELFTALMGRSPSDYLRHVRVERAKELLTTGGMPVGDIARASGFSDHAALGRVFRAETGHTPTAYRRIARTVD
jgi:AraC-like DNA-binding protein